MTNRLGVIMVNAEDIAWASFAALFLIAAVVCEAIRFAYEIIHKWRK